MMNADQFRAYVNSDLIIKDFNRCLYERNIEYDEYFSLLNDYLASPDSFILCGDSTEGHKRNNVITIYHMLANSYPPINDKEPFITFYSCGTSISQGDKLGHFDIGINNLVFRIDPGPGSYIGTFDILKQSSGKIGRDPLWLDGILMTHIHNDHTGGFQAIFERMRWNGIKSNKNKFIIANKTCINGEQQFDCGPILDKYKKNIVKNYGLDRGESIFLDGIKFTATSSKHVESVNNGKFLQDSCIGFKIETDHLSIGITGDTEWHSDLAKDFQGVDIIIAYIVQESERAGTSTQKDYGLNKKIEYHRQFLGEEGVIELAKQVKPELGIIITDYGDQMKSPDGHYHFIPKIIADRIYQRINGIVPIIPAEKGLTIKFIKNKNRYKLRYENNIFRK